METLEKLKTEELSPDLFDLIKDESIKESQVQIALYIGFTQEDIVQKTVGIKLLTELIDNTLTPTPFISMNDLRSIVLETDRDLYRIKKELNKKIDIDSLRTLEKVLVMSILDTTN